jgi:uncharacterized protein YjlB
VLPIAWAALQIANVPLPAGDPVYGAAGPLLEGWRTQSVTDRD